MSDAKDTTSMTMSPQWVSKQLSVVFDEMESKRTAAKAMSIVNELIGPGTTRLLHETIKAPKREHMARVISPYITANRPIPVLIAGAPKLPPFLPDYSEWQVIDVLIDLQQRVTAHYPPGLDIVLRVEDLTMMQVFLTRRAHLPRELAEQLTAQQELKPVALLNLSDPFEKRVHAHYVQHYATYAVQFRALLTHLLAVRLVARPKFLDVRLESELIDANRHGELLDRFSHLVADYIHASNPFIRKWEQPQNTEVKMGADEKVALDARATLASATGFRGDFCAAARDFFVNCYSNHYPDMDSKGQVALMSRYLSCTLARRHLKGDGHRHGEWTHGRIELSFVERIPGSEPFEQTRVWYKSALSTTSRQPYWKRVAVAHPIKNPKQQQQENAADKKDSSAPNSDGVKLDMVDMTGLAAASRERLLIAAQQPVWVSLPKPQAVNAGIHLPILFVNH